MPGDERAAGRIRRRLAAESAGAVGARRLQQDEAGGRGGQLAQDRGGAASAIEAAEKQYIREQAAGSDMPTRALFPELFPAQATQLSMFDLSDLDDAASLSGGEADAGRAARLRRQATNGKGLQRQFFADDAARGFAFIDVCRKRYDVVLMNPPFGPPRE